MQKEIVENPATDGVAVYVIWMPMVFGDSQAAAQSAGQMFAARRVSQYYDPHRRLGRACTSEAFRDCLRDALRATPRDNATYETIEAASNSPDDHPLWDAVLYYPPGVEWHDRLPMPSRWSKQVEFFGGQAEITGRFYRDDCAGPPADSSWRREVCKVAGLAQVR